MTKRVVKFGQLDLTVEGNKLQINDKAPNFKGVLEDLSDYDFYKNESFVCVICQFFYSFRLSNMLLNAFYTF